MGVESEPIAESGTAGTGELRREELIALVDISRELAARFTCRGCSTASSNKPPGSPILPTAASCSSMMRGSAYFADAVGSSSDMLLKRFGAAGVDDSIPIVGSKAGQVFTSRLRSSTRCRTT